MKARVLSIDAWRYNENWSWNQWLDLARDPIELPDGVTIRQLLKHARDNGYLSDYSKGRVAVEDDQYNLVIVDKNTREPLIAYCYGEYWEENGL